MSAPDIQISPTASSWQTSRVAGSTMTNLRLSRARPTLIIV